MKDDTLITVAIISLLLAAVIGTLLYFADPVSSNPLLCPPEYSYVSEVDICASNDYYKVQDIRMPVGMKEVKKILVEEGARLPTKEEVDAIWRAADIKLSPIPFTDYDNMTTQSEFVRHSKAIDKQLEQYGDISGLLIAGHKKDIIAMRKKGRVTIYGWHRQNGNPIQPVSSVHGSDYRDYSHGLRLIKAANH